MKYRLELDMRYGNQRVQTAVVSEVDRVSSQADVLKLITQFHKSYGKRFGEGSQSPETGVRINTIRVCSFVEQTTVKFENIEDDGRKGQGAESVGTRKCHFVGHDGPVETRLYDVQALTEGTRIDGLVHEGWASKRTINKSSLLPRLWERGPTFESPLSREQRERGTVSSRRDEDMNDIQSSKTLTEDERRLRDEFLAENRLFLGPDPEIMRNHKVQPRSKIEEAALAKSLDPHEVHHVRGLVNAALSEAFTMCNQMGAAPGAKWGDLVTGIYTAQGDLAMIAPQFMNRSVNTNIASFKAALCTGLLQNVWPDLPHTMAVLSPIEIISDRNSIMDAEGEMPQAMSLMPMFKACVVWTIPMNKFNYSVPHRYSACIASQYDQAATFIYGGLTQHGDVTGAAPRCGAS